jgi:biotin carboxyl carrier protein
MTVEKLNLQPLTIEDREYDTLYTRKFEARKPYEPPDPKKIRCVIPGIVNIIHVHPGKKVRRDESLLVIEAMKMQNDICAATDATIRSVNVRQGQMVTKGEVLIEFE